MRAPSQQIRERYVDRSGSPPPGSARIVLLKLPLNAKLQQKVQEIELGRHPAFAELQGLPGLAIIDYEHEEAKLHGYVVSLLPFLNNWRVLLLK